MPSASLNGSQAGRTTLTKKLVAELEQGFQDATLYST